jgi:tetratricopeptide (TPR) repeat protein
VAAHTSSAGLFCCQIATGKSPAGIDPALLGLALASVLLVALPANPRPPQTSPEQLLGQAREAQNRGDFAGAARKYTEAARLRPNAEVYEKLGLAHFLGNSYPQAVEAFSDALRIEPQRWASHLFMAESLYKLNRFEEALTSVKSALQLRPEENEARYWLGCIDHALGKYEEAIVHLSEASERDPKNVDILYSLTEAYLDYSTVLLNRLDSGTPSAQKRLGIDRQIGDVAARAQGAGNSTAAQLRTIARKYAAASEAAEPDSEALFTLSRVYGYLGQLTAEKVWQLQPDSYRSHELRGQSYENQKNYEAALAEYREALQINPRAPGLNYAVGHVYWEMKRLSQALPELERELALNPYHSSANYLVGHIYLRVDPQHPEKAALYLQRAVESKPDFVEARKQWGRALSLMHEDQKAVEQFQLAAKQDPHDDSVHYLLATIYKSMGLEDKARQELEVFDQLRAGKHVNDGTPQ